MKNIQYIKYLIFAATFALAAGFMAGHATGPAFALEGPRGGTLLVEFDDPINDDNGPGYYNYPTGKFFRSNKHLFDIRRVKIYEVGDFYRFDVEFHGKLVRQWPGYQTYRNGWIMNIAEIYVDTDHKWGSGHKKAILGRNVEFMPESQWEKVVFISPVAHDDIASAVRDKTDDLEFSESLSNFVFPTNIDVFDYTLSATVRRSELGDYSPKWGFQVLSTVLEPTATYMSFYNKRVYKTSTDEEFGGGTDLYGAPNVLDMIVPPGELQSIILGKYSAHPNYMVAEFAKIPMVYKESSLPAPPPEKIAAAPKKTKTAVETAKKSAAELAAEEPVDLDSVVKEKVLEIAKNEEEQKLAIKKPELIADARARADGKTSEKALSAEKSAAAKNEENAGKQKKNNSDKSKSDTAKSGYGDFFKKLGDQRKQVKKEDDENRSLDDIEKFLASKEDGKKLVKPAKKESKSGFSSDVYEMARITGKTDVRGAAPKKSEEKLKLPDQNIAEAGGTGEKQPNEGLTGELKPAEAPKTELAEAQAEEPEDKSIIGRLFKKKKKSQKAVTEEYKKSADSGKLLTGLHEADTKVLADETLAAIAKNELPENAKKKNAKKVENIKGGDRIIGEGVVAIEAKRPAAEAEKAATGIGGGCHATMRKASELAAKYLEKHPDARKISMNMLMTDGLIKEPMRCPDGGRYLIEVAGGKPKITCLNVNGTGHGEL